MKKYLISIIVIMTLCAMIILIYENSLHQIVRKNINVNTPIYRLYSNYHIQPIDEYYVKGNFIGLKAILDSSISLKIWRIGKFKGESMQNLVRILSRPPDKVNSLTTITSTPSVTDRFGEWYDVSALPCNSINYIGLYFEGELLNVPNFKDSLLVYQLSSSKLILTCNDIKNGKLEIFGKKSSGVLGFYKDKSEFINLFILNKIKPNEFIEKEELKFGNVSN